MPVEKKNDSESLSKTVKMDETTKDSIADKISDKFNATLNPESVKDNTEVIEKEEEPEVTEETQSSEEKPEKQIESAEKPSGGSPTIPSAYRRSLKASEWTDEEIDEAIKQQGVKFITYAERVHRDRKAVNDKMAELGRASRPKPADPASPAIRQGQDDELKPFDVKALKQQYGDDAIIDVLTGPVNQVIDRLNKILPLVNATQSRSQMAELETLGRQVDSFFGADDLKDYHDIYGKTASKATDSQLRARQSVLEHADALVVGYRKNGVNIPFDDAMIAAHDAYSSNNKEIVAREKIRKDLKAREKGITLKPSGKGNSSSGKPKGTDKEVLVQNTKQRLAKIFG